MIEFYQNFYFFLFSSLQTYKFWLILGRIVSSICEDIMRSYVQNSQFMNSLFPIHDFYLHFEIKLLKISPYTLD